MAEITELKGKRKVYERFMKSSEESVGELYGQDSRDFREQMDLPIPVISLFT